MIKFFRKIRQSLLSEGITSKYLKYAIGEIVLVVIGILIAVQINAWHTSVKENKLKANYTQNLINDLTQDTLQLHTRIKQNQGPFFLQRVDSVIAILENPNTTLEDIQVLAQNKPITGLRTMNVYNNNTFNILIATGDIGLFEDELIERIMELNSLQQTEIGISNGNRASYFEMYNSYLKQYIPNNRSNSTVIKNLWINKSAEAHAPIYINTLRIQGHAISRYIEATQNVIIKTEELLELLKLHQKAY
ncbi:DUF6090 family protein [Hanstruepera marina]|uniref:DUF6090 family protein n=1 Tax=Hanstruepera marina TaxID=2873265 RepID=UPI001CA6AEDA|nr:DUF6090 family protein [Hanstruepera marina]